MLATHVVDLLPYETRNCKLSLKMNEGEKFSGDTWHQAEFLDPNLRLPYPDKFFDFVVCSHTLEDLEEPVYLLNEIKRLSKAGYIEVPSRLDEQTLGIRDRASTSSGHPHHHWIIDMSENSLTFYSKKASLSKDGWQIPLMFTESLSKSNPYAGILEFYFQDSFSFTSVPDHDPISLKKSIQFVESLNIPKLLFVEDSVVRFGRRLKNRLLNKSVDYTWYKNIVELSRPYSSIPLK